MIGTSGRVGGKNYIVALDAETGNLAWRFNTIAQPGEPGGDTWNDHTAEERNGGSVWIGGKLRLRAQPRVLRRRADL